MRRTQKAWLNDVEFGTVHPALMLQHINESDPKISYKSAPRPKGGLFEMGRTIDRREIILEFAIREGLDFARRQEALSAAIAWGYKGGWLQLSDHPEQQIYVTMTTAPAMGQLRDWTHDLSMTFTAAWYPYWQNLVPSVAYLTSETEGYTYLDVLGTAPTVLCADIVPDSAALTSVSLSTPGYAIEVNLQDNPVAAGATLRLWYDNHHLMHIDSGSSHLLRYRIGDDDLLLQPGRQPVGYAFNTPCTAVLKCWGVWL